MPRLVAALLFAAALAAQVPAPESKDPLGRDSPQSSVFQFLEACHAREYSKALRYLDLRRMPPADRAKNGPELARQLEDLLDDTPFDIGTLSRNPEGDQADNASATLQHLDSFQVDGKSLEMQLERVELKPGSHVWLVSADSVAMIPQAHQLVAETPFEKKLPQQLVTFEVFDTPVWRWIALVLMGGAIWMTAGLLARLLLAGVKRLVPTPAFRAPFRIVLAVAGFRLALGIAPPATLSDLYIQRALGLGFSLAVAWASAVLIDMAAARWHSRLDPRVQAVSYSVLPLGQQVLKLSLFLIALLSVLSAWGYNTSTILAGLGVGGLAVALAAQKTIENLFGGISVIGDRPVLVGDVCRFGDKTGTVMHIGLRSTRIRTADRTVISVPNSQFSSIPLENISGRDKIWFHPTLNLRRDTTSEQMLHVLSSIGELLAKHPKVEEGKIPVRFIGVGPFSLDVEIAVYITTVDGDEFLELQQDLLLKMLQALETAGTALAVPLQESVASR
ncbi:MAG TPA: mechanosensitive ion channel family protein [Candidatus Acidoferrales bacterium]|jgi:MscS family membrane protein|nr:mechanosensitive ion channel family protein [Candidatus Acidoferrales bacterium]